MKFLRLCFLSLVFLQIIACSAIEQRDTTKISASNKSVPIQRDNTSLKQLIKTDLDRFADIEIRENIQSLKTLMYKLYKRNPKELKKSSFDHPEKAIYYLFDENEVHQYHFAALQHQQNSDAIFLAFNPQYQGDRVFAFIVGLQTMLLKAHGGTSNFYITSKLDPQTIYNVARNFEIAIWKLSNAKDEKGELYLLSNSLSETEKNLSIEREFGKIISRTDLFAMALEEKSQRAISRIIQNIATALFLPL